MVDKNEIIQSDEPLQQLKLVTESNFDVFLKQLGLPANDVLANNDEKQVIADNIQNAILKIPLDQRRNATYLSKFVSSVAIGRFDSALNDLWNEVVIQLRKSVTLYGLDIFFDVAVAAKDRDDYSKEDDLSGIKDRTLLDVCLKLEILTEVVHRKLVYILDMRNKIGGSHPNASVINAYELLGWLQTSVHEVIAVRPSEGAIKVQQFIKNLRTQKSAFSKTDLQKIEESLGKLSTVLSGNLLTAVFGIYTDSKVGNEIKININALAPTIWNLAPEQSKYDLGAKLETFTVNLEKDRQELGEQFFDKCGGNNYKTTTRKSLELTNLAADLRDLHNGWNNFFNEPSKARQIMSYIKSAVDIPAERQEDLIRTFLICRIGREVSYNKGVSPNAVPYYDKFFRLLNSNQIRTLLKVIQDRTILVDLSTPIRRDNFSRILEILPQVLSDERAQEAIDYLKEGDLPSDKKIMSSSFKELVKSF
ncbi:hypothetical protein [Lactiplantibacillus mudanjiangensis]|uniref:Uncharacterized protein n=1 Tax=Lactiplantibacillus mudanjiangensis TaxID=1296538 RepID=A0A660DXV4_9LACO|nr:hypothetical protein [Lactiplantibacillus mudanjiangensis]VDG22714.1 hypothetical protein MUDAN_IGPPGNFN_00257 [Lactiplantibacillus mudanjiangensis]VDG26747.1 hypothetical protein MUDAN_MDHGFNIF_00151 [Lactiplantibacillus mudanjiangensis]